MRTRRSSPPSSPRMPAGSATKDYAAAFAAAPARKPNATRRRHARELRRDARVHGRPAFRKRKAVENAMENSALGSRFASSYAMRYGGAGGVTYAAAQALGAAVADRRRASRRRLVGRGRRRRARPREGRGAPRREARAAAAEAAGRPRQGEPPRVSVEAAILRVECWWSLEHADKRPKAAAMAALRCKVAFSNSEALRHLASGRAAIRGVACGHDAEHAAAVRALARRPADLRRQHHRRVGRPPPQRFVAGDERGEVLRRGASLLVRSPPQWPNGGGAIKHRSACRPTASTGTAATTPPARLRTTPPC